MLGFLLPECYVKIAEKYPRFVFNNLCGQKKNKNSGYLFICYRLPLDGSFHPFIQLSNF